MSIFSDQVNYRCRIPEKAVLVAPKNVDEAKLSTSSKSDLILSKDECDALEKLFDRLVDSRNDDTPKRSMTESSIGSSVCDVDNDDGGDQGDESSDDDEEGTETEGRNVEKKMSQMKIQIKTEWLSSQRSTNVASSTKDDSSIGDKVRRKRKRNRTIDYHELPSGGDGDLWCGTVAGYTQRKFNDEPVFSTEVIGNKVIIFYR